MNKQKPLYIREIEATLGLKCEKVDDYPREWFVLSPTGVKMFRVGGFRDDVIGMVSTPEMKVIQGISREEISHRYDVN